MNTMTTSLKINIANVEVKKAILKLAIPASLEVVLQMLLGLVDVVFITWVGETELAGVGIANRVSSLMLMVYGTVGVGGAILISQYFGKKDYKSVSEISGHLLFYGVVISVISCIPTYVFADEIMAAMGAEGEVVAVGAVYFRIIVMSMAFALLSILATSVFRAVGDTRVPMIINTSALIMNVILNYLLIFGAGSIPAMGLEGCGYATLIARGVCFSLLAYFLYAGKSHVKLHLYHLVKLRLARMLQILNTSSAVLVGELSWAIGAFMYTVFFTRLGTTPLVASHVMFTVEEIFIMFSFGMTVAGMTMVGHEIGAKNEREMKLRANEIYKMGLMIACLFGVLLAIASRFLPFVFPELSPEVLKLAMWGLLFFAVFQPIKVANFVFGNGILKGGGDTMFVMYVDTFVVFAIGLPVAYVLGFKFDYGFYGVCIGRICEELVKYVIMYKRFRGEKWYRYLAH